jgi:peptidyl-prolyl cis-trans isomerase B (cyclophilin B)
MNKILLSVAFLSVCFISQESFAEGKRLPFSVPKNVEELPTTATVETSKGIFRIEFYGEYAPVTVRNFEYLSTKKFYNNLTFHRYEPGFVIQGGDPDGTGKGGPGYTLPPEFSPMKHLTGALGMARQPDNINYKRESNGSQFYICLSPAPHLDGNYTVFGRVSSGMDTVERLRAGDRIIGITIDKK